MHVVCAALRVASVVFECSMSGLRCDDGLFCERSRACEGREVRRSVRLRAKREPARKPNQTPHPPPRDS